jgi:transcriptional regulator with XRE-family HTH domain
VKISLKAARINADLTQKEAASLLGVTPLTIVNWESGQHKPRERKQDRIAEVYQCPKEFIKWE